MDSSAMRHPSKTQPLKNGSGGITAWHGAKTLQAAKKPTPFLLTSRCIESVPVTQCFPVNGTWLCFRKECVTRNKTLRTADKLGDRNSLGIRRSVKKLMVIVFLYTTFHQSDTRNFMKKATASDGGKKGW